MSKRSSFLLKNIYIYLRYKSSLKRRKGVSKNEKKGKSAEKLIIFFQDRLKTFLMTSFRVFFILILI